MVMAVPPIIMAGAEKTLLKRYPKLHWPVNLGTASPPSTLADRNWFWGGCPITYTLAWSRYITTFALQV